jgi:iron(III) transport system ATP-binding protein
VEKIDFSARSSGVELVGISKRFASLDAAGEVTAVNDVNLDVRDGELVTLLGPSGCGKTTTLRMIAGFEFPSEGRIMLGGKDVASVPPNKRGISMVFQSYALFPHLSIYENVAYGLRVQRLPQASIKAKTEAVLDLMQLSEMARRYPNQVSGGQQQRIALARAIVIEPRVLLFDEPLSNLDAKLREYMRDELRKLQKRLGITSIYVTHDQAEAMAISDRVVIMDSGRIRQVGTPREIYERPESRFVANFMGKANFVPATFEGREGEAAQVSVRGSRARLPQPGAARVADGEQALLVVRPEAVRLKKGAGMLSGRVSRTTYFGGVVNYEVESEGLVLLVESYNPQVTGVFAEGEGVGIDLDLDSIRLLPVER